MGSPEKQNSAVPSQQLSRSLTTLNVDYEYTSKTPSPPKRLSDVSLKLTSVIEPVHFDFRSMVGEDVFCLDQGIRERDGAVIVARNISLEHFWLILEKFGGRLPCMELRDGILVFLEAPEICHDIIISHVQGMLQKSLLPEYFYDSRSANFKITANSTKSPDGSFTPRFRKDLNANGGSFPTVVIEVVDSGSMKDLLEEKDKCFGETSEVMVFLGVFLPWPVPPPGCPIICSIIYWERDQGRHKGRHFIRRFDLNDLDALDTVAPEDAAEFTEWPWFHFPRRLVLHDVPFHRLPRMERFGGPKFSCNFRHIGDSIREGLKILDEHRNRSESGSIQDADVEERLGSPDLRPSFFEYTYFCTFCEEPICGLYANAIPTEEECLDQHLNLFRTNPNARECLSKAYGKGQFAVSPYNSTLHVGLVFRKIFCKECNVEIREEDWKCHEFAHKEKTMDKTLQLGSSFRDLTVRHEEGTRPVDVKKEVLKQRLAAAFSRISPVSLTETPRVIKTEIRSSKSSPILPNIKKKLFFASRSDSKKTPSKTDDEAKTNGMGGNVVGNFDGRVLRSKKTEG